MGLGWLSPGFFWLAPVALAFWFWPRRRRDTVHVGVRSLLWLLLIAALAEPVLIDGDDGVHQVLIIDRSPSVDADDRERARAFAARWSERAAPSRRTLITFGGDAWPEAARGFDDAVVIGAGGSPLSTALVAAGRTIAPSAGAAVTILSDGLATDRRWSEPLTTLSARGVVVHFVPLRARAGAARPVAFEAMGEWRVGHTARGRIRVAGTNVPATVTVSLGTDVLTRIDGVQIDGTATVPFAIEPPQAGFSALRVRVESAAGTVERAWTVAIQDPLRVLYLGRNDAAAARLRELVGHGFTLDAPAKTPESFAPYDLVVADDWPAERIPAAAQRALRDAVRDNGLGFWMSGGAGAFGPGGYHQTPVAQLLPVSFVQKEEKRDPSTTLVVIIDTSGSMGGTRVQLAKEVARLAIRRLLPHDKVGIVEFYGAKRWAAPIQPASNAIEIQRALNRLDAGGGTVIMPAIEESYYALQNVQTRFKHVLVLTDGGVEQGAFEPLLRKMAQKGVNVSAVLVGAQAHSEFLVSMANWGKGRFYAVPNRFNLPEILLKQPTTARLPAYRHGTHATRSRGGRGWWGNEGPVVTPPLDGYVELRRRRGAEVLLETVRGAHPLLATWRYGLGRVTTLATEPVGPGTRGWTQWPGYGAALARIWARTARRARPPFSYSLTRCDHRLRLVATRTVSGRVTPAAQRLGTAGAAAGSLAFDERADGVFVAEFTSAPADEVRIVAEAAGWPASRVRLCSTAFADVAPESMVDPTGAFDGALAAEQTGGAVLSLAGPDAAPSAGVGSALRLRELAPALLVLALLCFLADLALRRRSGLTTDNA